MPKMKMVVLVNFDNIQSIRKAEKKKRMLENKGYTLVRTVPVGLNKFKMMSEVKRQTELGIFMIEELIEYVYRQISREKRWKNNPKVTARKYYVPTIERFIQLHKENKTFRRSIFGILNYTTRIRASTATVPKIKIPKKKVTGEECLTDQQKNYMSLLSSSVGRVVFANSILSQRT